MHIRIHGLWSIVQLLEAIADPDHEAHHDVFLQHLARRRSDDLVGAIIIDALKGCDFEASQIARLQNEESGRLEDMDEDVLATLAFTCGGIDAHVAAALTPWLSDMCSIEDDETFGFAWRDGSISVQPNNAGGIILDTNGRITLLQPLPETVCAAAAGRRLREIIDDAGLPGDRIVASVESDDDRTIFHLA